MKRCLFAFYLCLLVDGLEWVSYQHRRHVAPAVSLRYWLRKASWSSRRTPCVCCPVVVYFSLLDGVFSFGLRKTRALSQHLLLDDDARLQVSFRHVRRMGATPPAARMHKFCI